MTASTTLLTRVGTITWYVYDLERRASRQITAIEEEAWFTPLDVDGRKLVLVTYDRPHEHEVAVVDPASGSELGRKHFDTAVSVIGFDKHNRMIISETSAATPFSANELLITVEDGEVSWQVTPKIRLPDQFANAVEQCNVERVEYPTFDIDPATGQRRMLHAFLMTPNGQGLTQLNGSP